MANKSRVQIVLFLTLCFCSIALGGQSRHEEFFRRLGLGRLFGGMSGTPSSSSTPSPSPAPYSSSQPAPSPAPEVAPESSHPAPYTPSPSPAPESAPESTPQPAPYTHETAPQAAPSSNSYGDKGQKSGGQKDQKDQKSSGYGSSSGSHDQNGNDQQSNGDQKSNGGYGQKNQKDQKSSGYGKTQKSNDQKDMGSDQMDQNNNKDTKDQKSSNYGSSSGSHDQNDSSDQKSSGGYGQKKDKKDQKSSGYGSGSGSHDQNDSSDQKSNGGYGQKDQKDQKSSGYGKTQKSNYGQTDMSSGGSYNKNNDHMNDNSDTSTKDQKKSDYGHKDQKDMDHKEGDYKEDKKPVDCEVGDWSEWSQCSAPCGGGRKTRTREIVTQDSCGGAPCPPTSEEAPCNTECCKVNCVVGDWSPWGTCSKQCGGGTKTRSRPIITHDYCGGTACPDVTEEVPCNTGCCEVPCVVGEWANWGSCSAPCGGGTKTRTREITTPASCGGCACPHTTETSPCNTECCKVNCEVSEWSSWGTCSKQCGGGTMSRTRRIVTQPYCGGYACPPLKETSACNSQCCKVDCEVGPWTEWGQCSAKCGGGTRTRSREIVTESKCGGYSCPPLTETSPCNTECCKVNCEVGPWTEWGTCSAKCGGGTRSRSREIVTRPYCGGDACPTLSETSPCNTECCKVDCEVGPWTEWGQCSKRCGGGTRSRSREIVTQPSCGGYSCPTLSETSPCNTECCKVNCEVGPWTEWGTCSARCGGGTRTRSREIVTRPYCGGDSCPTLTETSPCNTECCKVDCEVGPWTEWGTCSKQCGGGTRSRSREIVTQPSCGGYSCPALSETSPCNTECCKVNCEVGPWSEWGTCTAKCGGGTKTRSRHIITESSCGGSSCPETVETVPCNTDCCKVNCECGDWSSWGSCSSKCGGGYSHRTRAIRTHSSCGGDACPPTDESQACNTQCCAEDCVLGDWTSWGSCSKDCGGGTKPRTRKVLKPAKCGGSCGGTAEDLPCNTQPCQKSTKKGGY